MGLDAQAQEAGALARREGAVPQIVCSARLLLRPRGEHVRQVFDRRAWAVNKELFGELAEEPPDAMLLEVKLRLCPVPQA
jgi:hypothetical protein